MAAEEGDALFVSKLDEKSKGICKRELKELNDKDRVLAVQTLRKWVLDQDWLKTPTDFAFLLRFLRVRKFSQLGARQTLENYWVCKDKMPSMYRNLDPADPLLQKILKTGFVYGLKNLDKDGCRLMFNHPGAIQLKELMEFGVYNAYKALILVFEWMQFDENAQVNGMKVMVDFTDMVFQLYLAHANVDNQKSIMKFLQKSMPIRLKGQYFYNEPSFFDVFMAFFGPFFTPKFKDRLKIVGKNLADLYKQVDTSLLPTEYLPDDHKGPSAGPMAKVIDEMIADMNQPKFRDYIRDISSPKYGIDRSKRADTEKEPAASFRKLNVD